MGHIFDWIAIAAVTIVFCKLTLFNLAREIIYDFRDVSLKERRDLETLILNRWAQRLLEQLSGRRYYDEAVSFGIRWGELFDRRWPHLIGLNLSWLFVATVLLVNWRA